MTPPEDEAGEPEDAYVREVRGKAERLSRARRLRGGFWQHVAQVADDRNVRLHELADLGRVDVDVDDLPGGLH